MRRGARAPRARAAGRPRLDAHRAVLLGQGVYFVATGIWPVVHLPSFERITGPKRDDWLVRTVGVLVTVIGAVLAGAALRRTANAVPGEVDGLSVGSALALAGIDVIHVARREIAPIYLADAAAELALAVALTVARQQEQQSRD